MAQYKYKPLPSRQIRLFSITPGQGKQRLRCKISHESLHNPDLRYTAISYVWGSPKRPATVYCSGSALKIPSSLYQMLWQLRESNYKQEETPFQHNLFWADSICINQYDKDEKTSQVRLMNIIYGRASETIAWLGEISDDSGVLLAIWTAKCLQSLFRIMGPHGTSSFAAYIYGFFLWLLCNAEHWEGVKKMTSHPWFRRVWTIEECVLSKSFWFMYGNRKFRGSILIEGVSAAIRDPGLSFQMFSDHHKGKPGFNFSTDPVAGGITISQLLYSTKQYSFLDLLDLTKYYEAHDARDKLFAVSQLPQAKATITIDYNKDVRSTYIEMMILFLTNGSSTDGSTTTGLEVLSEVRNDIKSTELKLPSWVPDWRVVQRRIPLYRGYGEEYELKVAPVSFTGKDLETLMLRGQFLDTIGFILSDDKDAVVAAGESNTQFTLSANPGWYEKVWARCYTLLGQYPTGEPLLEAFCRSTAFNQLDAKSFPELAKCIAVYTEHMELLHSCRSLLEEDEETQSRQNPWWIILLAIITSNMDNRTATCVNYLTLAIACKGEWKSHGAAWWVTVLCLGIVSLRYHSGIAEFLCTCLVLANTLRKRAASADRATPFLRMLLKKKDSSDEFLKTHVRFSGCRVFGATTGGYMGWWAPHARKGDLIYRFTECRTLFVLRADGQNFRLVGDTYIYGLTDVEVEGSDEVITII